MGLFSSIFGGGGSSTSVQNSTTVTVNPQIENKIQIVNDDSRLQKLVDNLALGQQAAAQIGILQAQATLKTAEVAERNQDLTESNMMKIALIGGAFTLAAAFVGRS